MILAGHSVEGQPIVAVRSGAVDAPRKVLVIGDIHGNERAGRSVVRALRRSRPPAGTAVWTVLSANPDGERANTRQNARGVDLNRNFPARWRGGGRRFDTYYPGPRAASEPETRAVQRLAVRLKPDVTITYHQHLNLVVVPRRGRRAIARRYASRTRMRRAFLPKYRGTQIGWQNTRLPGTTAFVVELPAGRLGRAAVRRHTRAVLTVVSPLARAGP